MTQETQQQVKVHIDERRGKASVRWKVSNSGAPVADVRQDLVGGRCDTTVVTRAIAEHFGVAEDAVQYVHGNRAGGTRLVASQALVTLPPPKPEPQTCGHELGEQGCGLADCDGTPPVDTPMDRDRTPIPAEPGPHEFGTVTDGQEITQAVAKATGMAVTDAVVANNGWSDTRWGGRKVEGLLFKVGGIDVRVLSYEAQASGLARGQWWFAAVYVDEVCVAPAIELKLRDRQWLIVQAIVRNVETRHDERALARPTTRGWWALKNPPVGFNVTDARHGIVEVVEKSTNDGMTLRVVDAAGKPQFIDRASAGWWTAAYGGAAIGGDTWARYQRRTEFMLFVGEFRHKTYGHDGDVTECGVCAGEVAGSTVGGQHRWGRYVTLPWCALCGKPVPPDGVHIDTSTCPGTPRHPDTGSGAADIPAPPAPPAVPPIFSGIPHVFQPKPEGHEGGPSYCVAPCHNHVSAEVHTPAPVQEPTPVARVHVRSSSPILVALGRGRQGLANPTWCGRINDEKAWHAYGLKHTTVTCPVCFHLFTCAWAGLDSRAEFCAVCAHVGSCEDAPCQDGDHPGVVPEPDPNFDWQARLDAVVARMRQALADGDFDLADKLIDVAEDYQAHYGVYARDSWEDLRTLVWRKRKQAQEQAQTVPDAEPDAGVPAPPAAADGPTIVEVDGVTVAVTSRVDLSADAPADADASAGPDDDDDAGVLWAAALDAIGA